MQDAWFCFRRYSASETEWSKRGKGSVSSRTPTTRVTSDDQHDSDVDVTSQAAASNGGNGHFLCIRSSEQKLAFSFVSCAVMVILGIPTTRGYLKNVTSTSHRVWSVACHWFIMDFGLGADKSWTTFSSNQCCVKTIPEITLIYAQLYLRFDLQERGCFSTVHIMPISRETFLW